MDSLQSNDIRYALKVARENGMRYLRLKSEDAKFEATLSLRPSHVPDPSPVITSAAAVEVRDAKAHVVVSPVVGYFQPTSAPASKGDTIEAGQIVAEIVALGLINEVESERSGIVLEVLVKPGEPVEFGQPILSLEESE